MKCQGLDPSRHESDDELGDPNAPPIEQNLSRRAQSINQQGTIDRAEIREFLEGRMRNRRERLRQNNGNEPPLFTPTIIKTFIKYNLETIKFKSKLNFTDIELKHESMVFDSAEKK